jgi:hypothetical protein
VYPSEKNFIMVFLAFLKKMRVSRIPYDDEKFHKGAESMQRYFQNNRTDLGKYQDEIAMLFLKDSFGGKFTEFKDGVGRQNGNLMSFENPFYLQAEIKLDEAGVAYILEKNNTDIPSDKIAGLCKAFCEGAEIHPAAES